MESPREEITGSGRGGKEGWYAKIGITTHKNKNSPTARNALRANSRGAGTGEKRGGRWW